MQIEKAESIVQFCGVLKRENNKPTVIQTPASTITSKNKRLSPRCAIVTLKRGKTLFLSCKSVDIYGDGEQLICKAEETGQVCYHGIAALMMCAAESNGELEFSKTEGSFLVQQGKAKFYVTFKKKSTLK